MHIRDLSQYRDPVIYEDRLDEVLPAFVVAAAGWIAAFAAVEVGAVLLQELYLYYERANFKPDPRAIPNKLDVKFKGGDGKSYWMRWDSMSNRWYNPNDPKFKMPLGNLSPKGTEQFYRDGFKEALSKKGWIKSDRVTKFDLDRAIAFVDAEKANIRAKGDWKDLDSLYEKYVMSGSRADRSRWQRKVRGIGRSVGGMALLWGPAFYYWTVANEARFALDEQRAAGLIDDTTYRQDIKTIRAAFFGILVTTFTGAVVTVAVSFLIKSVSGVVLAKAAKETGVDKLIKKQKKVQWIAYIGGGVVGAYFAGTETGRKQVINALDWFGPGFSENVDNTQKWIYNVLVSLLNFIGGNFDSYWKQAADNKIADPEIQKGADNFEAGANAASRLKVDPDASSSTYNPDKSKSQGAKDFLQGLGIPLN